MFNLAGFILVCFSRKEGIDRASISTTARPHWLSTLATATEPTSTGYKLITSAIVSISAVPTTAFRSTTGEAKNAKAESTQTIVYRGSRSSRSGGDRCCFHRCNVRPWFATDINAQTYYTGNTLRKPTRVGVFLNDCHTGEAATNDQGHAYCCDNRQ